MLKDTTDTFKLKDGMHQYFQGNLNLFVNLIVQASLFPTESKTGLFFMF
jgi:hypothetical protein